MAAPSFTSLGSAQFTSRDEGSLSLGHRLLREGRGPHAQSSSTSTHPGPGALALSQELGHGDKHDEALLSGYPHSALPRGHKERGRGLTEQGGTEEVLSSEGRSE